MQSLHRCILSLLAAVFLLAACRKNDSTAPQNDPGLSKLVADFLKGKQTNGYYAAKVQRISDNVTNPRIIKVGETESIVCDLKTYRNAKKPNYPYTYYKVLLLKFNGKIQLGYIYTIHTSMPEAQFNAGITDIVTLNNSKFTGEIVVNALDDRFLSSSLIKDGKQVNTKEVRKKPKIAASNQHAASNGCTDYYLVTTTYYTDGSSEEEWSYLFTSCDYCGAAGEPSHIQMECPPGDDGGGSGGGEDRIIREVSVESEEVDNGGDPADPNAGGRYAPVKYTHTALISFTGPLIDNVEISNTNASPLVSSFVDVYGISGTRSLTLFGHLNTHTPLLQPFVTINWFCMVNGRYITVDGRVWTYQWNHQFSRTY